MNKIEFGDNRETMKRWAEEGVKVQTCVTSPPYYGLRDYGTATYEGGDPNCEHTISGYSDNMKPDVDRPERDGTKRKQCIKCGATRVDSQLGLEETPEEYIENMVDVFRHVKDILADDGTLWVNLGDSYYNYRPGKGQSMPKQTMSNTSQDLPQETGRRANKLDGLKEKDLIGIPWMFAFAMRADGWYLRQDIIWAKGISGDMRGGTCMPESVKDRCTKSHEYIFLFSKSPKYYFDDDAIKEPTLTNDNTDRDRDTTKLNNTPGRSKMAGLKTNSYDMGKRRSVWQINPRPYKGTHFAVYPQELIKPCILAGSKPGDIVLDPFMGSGTTAATALKYGRQYMGCELNPEYGPLQQERIANEQIGANPDLFEVVTQEISHLNTLFDGNLESEA